MTAPGLTTRGTAQARAPPRRRTPRRAPDPSAPGTRLQIRLLPSTHDVRRVLLTQRAERRRAVRALAHLELLRHALRRLRYLPSVARGAPHETHLGGGGGVQAPVGHAVGGRVEGGGGGTTTHANSHSGSAAPQRPPCPPGPGPPRAHRSDSLEPFSPRAHRSDSTETTSRSCTDTRGSAAPPPLPAPAPAPAPARSRAKTCRARYLHETCPISTEGWTRRVHFIREVGLGRRHLRDPRLNPPASRALRRLAARRQQLRTKLLQHQRRHRRHVLLM